MPFLAQTLASGGLSPFLWARGSQCLCLAWHLAGSFPSPSYQLFSSENVLTQGCPNISGEKSGHKYEDWEMRVDRWTRTQSVSDCGSPGRLDFTLQPIFFRSAVSRAPDCYSEKFGWSRLPWLTEWQNQGRQGLGRFRVSTCLGSSMSEGVSGCGAIHAKTQIGCHQTCAFMAFICEMRFHAPVNAQGTLHPQPQCCLDCSSVDWSVSPDSSRSYR